MEEVITKHQQPVGQALASRSFSISRRRKWPRRPSCSSSVTPIACPRPMPLSRSFPSQDFPHRARAHPCPPAFFAQEKKRIAAGDGSHRAPFSPRFSWSASSKRSAVGAFPYVDKKSPSAEWESPPEVFPGDFCMRVGNSLFSFSEPLFGERTTSSEVYGKKTYGFQDCQSLGQEFFGRGGGIEDVRGVSR